MWGRCTVPLGNQMLNRGEGDGGTTDSLGSGAVREAPSMGTHSQHHPRTLGFKVTSKSIQSSFSHHGHAVIFRIGQVPGDSMCIY